MSQFDELLAEIKAVSEEQTTLAKALPAEDGKDDQAIQAAAAEGDDANPKNPEDEEEGAEGGEGKPMAKSVTAMVNGEEVEAVDATDLLKSLDARVAEHDAVLAKAFGTTLATIKAQGELIKSMSARLDKLAGQGTGRKTVLTVMEKPPVGEQTMVKSEHEGLTPASFLAKATAAFDAKKITGKELTTIDVALRTGQVGVLDQSLIAKALS